MGAALGRHLERTQEGSDRQNDGNEDPSRSLGTRSLGTHGVLLAGSNCPASDRCCRGLCVLHAPTVRKRGATGKSKEVSYLKWSGKLTSGQSGKKLSSDLSSKRRVAAPWIPSPTWWARARRCRPCESRSGGWWRAVRAVGDFRPFTSRARRERAKGWSPGPFIERERGQ